MTEQIKEFLPKTKKEKRKKLILNIIFVFINILAIGIVLFLEQKNDSFITFGDAFKIMLGKWYFLIVFFLLYILHIIVESLCYQTMLNKAGYKNLRRASVGTMILGAYYDNLTPWAVGGQPFQIYYLSKNGVDTPNAFCLPLVKYAIRMLFIDVLIITLFIVKGIEGNVWVEILAYVGIFLSSFPPALLIAFSFFPKTGVKLCHSILRFLHRIKLIKNLDKHMQKLGELTDNFLKAVNYMSTHKSVILKVGILSLIDIIAISSVPFMVVLIFGGNAPYFDIVTLALYVFFASSFAPTPGTAGVNEATFYVVFNGIVQNGLIFYAVLLTRIFNFYLPITIGLIFQAIELSRVAKLKKLNAHIDSINEDNTHN